jgi:hypothetical protein
VTPQATLRKCEPGGPSHSDWWLGRVCAVIPSDVEDAAHFQSLGARFGGVHDVRGSGVRDVGVRQIEMKERDCVGKGARREIVCAAPQLPLRSSRARKQQPAAGCSNGGVTEDSDRRSNSCLLACRALTFLGLTCLLARSAVRLGLGERSGCYRRLMAR